MALRDQDRLSCLTSRVLQLILMPTERCNYRCTYCFERFDLGRMDRWVVFAVKRFLRRRVSDLNLLRLDWFGGEPLLAMDIVEDVQRHAMALSRGRSELRLEGSMTTNAHLLDRERFSLLLSWGVRRFQISLDGTREVHDTMRLTAGGRATFDRIWANLLAAQRSKDSFEIVVRLQVHDKGHSRLAEFLDLYARTFGGNERFTLAVVPMGCSQPRRDGAASALRAAAEAAERYARAKGLRLRCRGPGPVICYASRANSFIVRSDGTLSKCTFGLYHPQNRVGRLNEDGTVELDAGKMNWFMRGLGSGDERQLSCPMRGLVGQRARGTERSGTAMSESGVGSASGPSPGEGDI